VTRVTETAYAVVLQIGIDIVAFGW